MLPGGHQHFTELSLPSLTQSLHHCDFGSLCLVGINCRQQQSAQMLQVTFYFPLSPDAFVLCSAYPESLQDRDISTPSVAHFVFAFIWSYFLSASALSWPDSCFSWHLRVSSSWTPHLCVTTPLCSAGHFSPFPPSSSFSRTCSPSVIRGTHGIIRSYTRAELNVNTGDNPDCWRCALVCPGNVTRGERGCGQGRGGAEGRSGRGPGASRQRLEQFIWHRSPGGSRPRLRHLETLCLGLKEITMDFPKDLVLRTLCN